MRFAVPLEIRQICQQVQLAGGRALLVGGWVRDSLLKRASKDFDVEVYGLEADRLRNLLMQLGRVNTVGESFTVYKLTLKHLEESVEVDVSLPRRESKTGQGHRGFTMTGDPRMTIAEAARRRDFTINAILYDPLQDELLDPYGGLADLERRTLRVVDPTTFIEDSLRVLRAMQFAARFQLHVAPETVALCRSIKLNDLPAERIWGEFEKLLLQARYPSLGLETALELGILAQLFPQLVALVGCPQEPEWHPEGDVWIHTRLVIDQAARLAQDLPKEKRLTVLLAALCHDFGKPLTTEVVAGRIRSFGHDQAGLPPTRQFLQTLNVQTVNNYNVREQVLQLVLNHLMPAHFYHEREQIGDGAFRRLAQRCELDLLYRVAKADSLGRTAAYSEAAEVEWFMRRVRALDVAHAPPAPLVLGRHLLPLGITPGPALGRILRDVYEMQLDGQVTSLEQGLEAARALLAAEGDKAE